LQNRARAAPTVPCISATVGLSHGEHEGQCATGGRRCLRSHGHALGQAGGPGRPRLRKV